MRAAIKIIIFLSMAGHGLNLSAQQGIVLRGSVKDKETGEVIIGANVIEYDRDKRIITGTITDPNGNYVLNVTNPDAIIMISFIGYKPQEIPLNGRKTLNVELESESYDLEAVTVTATASNDPLTGVSQRNMASSRVKIDMAESKHIVAVSAEEALVGKVTGLDIMSFSGDPGSGSSIVIRGLGSLGSANPLIVVDGIPQTVAVSDFDFASADQEDIGDLVNIAPQDIKSIEVLKDAGSTAQWGSKGANGVLQIETFRGTKGKTRFDYQGKYTWNFQPPPIPMLNGDEYVMMQLEEWHNARGIYEVPPEIAYDRDYIDFFNYNKNTDWVDAVTQTGFINEQFFKLSGGGEKTRYYASLNLHDNKGTTINTGLQRVSTRINLDYNVSRKIRFSVNFSYTNSYRESNYEFNVYNELTNRYERTNIREMAYRKAPNMSIYEYDYLGRPTGEYFTPVYSYQGLGTQYFNPVAVGNLSTNDIREQRIRNDFTLNYNIRPWVRFQQIVSFQYLNQKKKRFLPKDAVGADWLNSMINQASEDNSSNSQIITRSQLFFLPRINSNHVLSGSVMFETDQQANEWTSLSSRNGPSTSLQDPAANATLNYISSGQQETHILGILASVNYVVMDRYGLLLNYRADASSRFGANNRWGSFPSLGVFWRFSNEPWLEGLTYLSEAKINYSYGLAGKQPRGAYDRHAIFREPAGSNQYIVSPIVVQEQIQLSNLKWQTLYSHNLKLDLGFFQDRLNFTGEIYRKITEDLLWNWYKIPKSSGYTYLKWYNGGSVENKGWELALYMNPLRHRRTLLNLNFNISQNINTFLEFPENFNNERDQNIGNGQYPRRANLGQPIGSFYGFRYLGVWPSDEDVVALNRYGDVLVDVAGNPVPLSYKDTYRFQGGDARYEDVNHDGKIDILDVVYLGDSNPNFIGGFGGSLNWRDFRIFTQWHYRIGFQIVNEIAMNTQGMLGKDNQSKAVLNRWRAQGQDEPRMLPRAYLDHPANNLGSDRYVEDGDFLRLVNLTVAYDLPKSVCRKLRIRSLDIAVTMRRVFTFTRYTGQDPEIPQQVEDPFWFGTDKARTPPPKAYTLSIGLGF
jgi:TonB-linked SusC/RagA family outer membrane protein